MVRAKGGILLEFDFVFNHVRFILKKLEKGEKGDGY